MATQPQQTPERSYLEGAYAPLSGADEDELRAMHPQDGVIRSLDKSGLPITRANYILRMHGSYPSDEEWAPNTRTHCRCSCATWADGHGGRATRAAHGRLRSRRTRHGG